MAGTLIPFFSFLLIKVTPSPLIIPHFFESRLSACDYKKELGCHCPTALRVSSSAFGGPARVAPLRALEAGECRFSSRFETDGLKAQYCQEVETRALSTLGVKLMSS